MVKLWNFLSNLGKYKEDSDSLLVWKSMQNQLILVFFGFLLVANAAAILLSPTDQILRVVSFLGLLIVVLVLHAKNRFRLARLLVMLLFIPICFVPNWALGSQVKLPYLSVNSSIVYMLEYLILSFILIGPGHKFRLYYIAFFMALFVLDVFYIPLLFEVSSENILGIIKKLDFMIFKTIFAIIIMMQLFTMHFVGRLIQNLMEANQKLNASIEKKLEEVIQRKT